MLQNNAAIYTPYTAHSAAHATIATSVQQTQR
jgi:hypothetical protein